MDHRSCGLNKSGHGHELYIAIYSHLLHGYRRSMQAIYRKYLSAIGIDMNRKQIEKLHHRHGMRGEDSTL